MMTWDPPTNSILVANASAAQLREIEELIRELDQPAPNGLKISKRVTGMVKIQYSRASIIAAALKEVYVDLLSSRDKEFATGDERGGASTGSKSLTEFKFGDAQNGNYGTPPRIAVAFGGELSIGVDDVSNHLLISCREELFDGVVAMIKKLDEESAPKLSIVVHSVSGSVTAENMQKAVSESAGRRWLGGRPADEIAAGPRQGNENANNGNNNQRPQGNNRGRGNRGNSSR
jgi:type II secretory pathway component GspD/PulD (secretin)